MHRSPYSPVTTIFHQWYVLIKGSVLLTQWEQSGSPPLYSSSACPFLQGMVSKYHKCGAQSLHDQQICADRRHLKRLSWRLWCRHEQEPHPVSLYSNFFHPHKDIAGQFKKVLSWSQNIQIVIWNNFKQLQNLIQHLTMIACDTHLNIEWATQGSNNWSHFYCLWSGVKHN